MSKKTILIILLLFSVLIVVGMFSEDGQTSRPTVTAPTPEPAFDRASAQQVEKLRYFLENGMDVRHVYTASAQDAAGGHFVAAEVVGSGGYVGVWWMAGATDSPGMTLAVDFVADEACVCPWAEDTRSTISMNDAPAEQLKEFVSEKVR